VSASAASTQGARGIERNADELEFLHQHCIAAGEEISTFYPSTGQHTLTRRAKALCKPCPVRQQCLDYALKYHENEGTWGGFTVNERKAIKRFARAGGSSIIADLEAALR
jgi:WhiB family redox-sensing transcriptional regulator